MSLYIGNMSSRIRRDELQRVFEKFGPCNVRMKDGYGFVVYEFPPDADKALRALQKRHICGEPLTLTWSNKQPRPFKRSARGVRSFEPQHDRNSEKGKDYVKGKLDSKYQGHDTNVRQSDGFSKRHRWTNINEKEVESHQDDTKYALYQGNHGRREEFEDEIGRFEPDALTNDRWGEKFHDQATENGVGNAVEFERYEPYQDRNSKYDDGIDQVACYGGSPSRKSLPKDRGLKLNVTCYRCGVPGHKMHNCPHEGPLLRNSPRFNRRLDNYVRGRGRGAAEIGSTDEIAKRRIKNDAKSSSGGKQQRPISSVRSPVRKESDNHWDENGGGNKRSRNEIRTSSRYSRAKKARKSDLSPCHSLYTASQTHSASKINDHVKRSRPERRSNSVSPRSHALSHELRSSSRSLDSTTKKSRSRSSSRTSLSVSIGRPLPSLSNKAQLNLKGSPDNARTPESKALLVDLDQPFEGDIGYKNMTRETVTEVMNNENGELLSKSDLDLNIDLPIEKDKGLYSLTPESQNEETNITDAAAETQKDTTDSSRIHEGMVHPNSNSLITEYTHAPIKNPDSEPLVGSSSGNPKSISSEELSMVLKHYCGVHFETESEMLLPADEYFGAARLWPWEVIYYRRLKKGPISLENYARRVDQNREFGIIDKYIRSSSGWGELCPDNS